MDELEISGKRYISSRRAAKEHKYHVDYIGQLIRSGKVLGSKVGRSWYVEADSLSKYLRGEAREVVPITVGEQKQFIAESAYTPPVVQKIQVKEKDEIREVPLALVEDTQSHTIAIHKMPSVGLTYIADEAPLLPEIRPAKPTYIPYPEEIGEKIEPLPSTHIEKSSPSFVPAVVLVAVGMVVLAGVAVGSIVVNSRIVLEQGKPAMVEYSFQK